jgi:hypothetical protein
MFAMKHVRSFISKVAGSLLHKKGSSLVDESKMETIQKIVIVSFHSE